MARRKKKPTQPTEAEQQTPTEEPTPAAEVAAEGATSGPDLEAQAAPKATQPSPEEQPTPEGQPEAEAAATEEDPQARIAALESALHQAQNQAQEYLAGWQRERAAFANYKRRVAEQQEQQRQQLLAEVVKDFLEILDDLELALSKRPQAGEGAQWAEGVELIYRKLRQKLELKGVEQVPAEAGMPFDPRYHEAISREAVDGQESGQIIEVLRAGYRIGDLVIRPALVRVTA